MNIPSELHKLSEQQPNQVLFEDAAQTLTAHELYRSASDIAARLQNLGISPQSNVGILLPRGLQASTCIYAVLMMGGVYLPIDLQNPQERIEYIVGNAKAKCIIGRGTCPDWVSQRKLPYLNIQNPAQKTVDPFRPVAIESEQLAALLYTSGSTGSPKGVAISHRAILAFAKWGQDTFQINNTDRIANLAPYHFDLSLFDLFTAPLAGATTITLPDSLKFAPSKLVDWLIQTRITTWYTVPSILGFIALKGGLSEKSLPDLRQILFAGEVFPTPKLKQLMTLLPTSKFYNLFGPTETNVCLYWPVEPDRLMNDTAIPAGIPAANAKLKIDIETEELLVKSPCLMSGYWENGKPVLTIDNQGWFHTGDKISANDQHEYEYHGRLDRMLKSAGYRIEPAEIEAILNSAENVEACAVFGVADVISGTKIIAAIAGSNVNQRSLRSLAKHNLPPYMQPANYFMLDKLPMLSNGKIDYRTIRQIFMKPAP